MKFSIVIPTYNSGQYIELCIQSVLALKCQERYEIIVVDGGSVDSTLDILQKYGDIKVVFSENKSISNSRNIGVASSSGENLVFIDSDCLATPCLLLEAERQLVEHECCGSFYKADKNHGWVARTWLKIEKKENGLVKWITAGTLIVRRDLFLKIGGFNEALQTDEDEDFGYRVRRAGGTLYNDEIMASIHLGQADDIKTFFMKEMWRGRTLIKPRNEKEGQKKMTMFDVVIVLYLSVIIMLIGTLLLGKMLWALFFGMMFFAGSFIISLIKTVRIGDFKLFVHVNMLYIIYLVARSLSLVRYVQFVRYWK